MFEQHVKALTEIVGENRITVDPLILENYKADLAPMPPALLKAYGMLGPDVVVLPKTIEQIAKIASYAYQHDIPITPRGAGTTALGGTLPMEGGIVMDFCGMSEIIEFNAEDEYITVTPGIEWMRVSDYVEARGFQLGAYPSSAPSATIGGFLATGGGGGIGIPRFGTVGDQVLEMKVVLADGQIVTTNPWNSWLFVGAEGTMGIIGQVTLKVYPQAPRKHYLFGFDSLEEGIQVMDAFAQLRPYFLSALDRGFISFLNRSGIEDVFPKALTVSVMFQGNEEYLEMIDARVKELTKNAFCYSPEVVHHEWENKFKIGLVFKKLGPSLFAQEFRIANDRMAEAYAFLQEVLREEDWGIETLGSVNQTTVVVIYMLADERNLPMFMKKFSYIAAIEEIIVRYGATPFGIGCHNTAHLDKIHPDAVPAMETIRQFMDPQNILNPSKTTQVRVPASLSAIAIRAMGWMPEIVWFGLETMKHVVPVTAGRLGLEFVGGKLR